MWNSDYTKRLKLASHTRVRGKLYWISCNTYSSCTHCCSTRFRFIFLGHLSIRQDKGGPKVYDMCHAGTPWARDKINWKALPLITHSEIETQFWSPFLLGPATADPLVARPPYWLPWWHVLLLSPTSADPKTPSLALATSVTMIWLLFTLPCSFILPLRWLHVDSRSRHISFVRQEICMHNWEMLYDMHSQWTKAQGTLLYNCTYGERGGKKTWRD